LRAFKGIVQWVLVTVAMACLLWPVCVDLTFAYTMPTSPQPDQGRIHRIVVSHGSVVYVTEKELHRADLAFNRIFLIGIVFGGLLGVVQVYWKPRDET
jgi:hypothetical protein